MCIRDRDYDRHHAALRQSTSNASRVETFETYSALQGYFMAGASAEMDVVRDEVSTAILLQSFNDANDLEF